MGIDPSSEGRMPEIAGHAAVFQDQISTGGAFEDENLRRQMKRAAGNPSPPWRQGKQRKKIGKRESKPVLRPFDPPAQLTGEELREAWWRYGVPYAGSLVYPINLCDDGSVVTGDGELIGTWGMDQYDAPSFAPDRRTAPMLEVPRVGLLCMRIRDWYEKETGEKL